jgi:two-component system, response regulator YesN
VEGKWLIADRDLNEREGLKWLLKTSSIPVTAITLAADYQEFILLFEKEAPDIVFIELDMIDKRNWSSFRNLMQLYDPVLVTTSAEATFEKARQTIELQALDLMVKPFSATKIKSAFHSASRKLGKKHQNGAFSTQSYKDISYEFLFLQQPADGENHHIAAFQTESRIENVTLHSFLTEFPFKDQQGIFGMSELVIVLFKDSCRNITEQCQKVMRKWEEEFSEPLAIVVNYNTVSDLPLNEKYLQTEKMLEFTYYKGYRQVVEFTDSPEWTHIDPFLAPPEQRDWVEMLEYFDLEKIKNWLYNEFLKLQEPYPDPGLVRIRLTSILAQIRRFMKTNHLDEETLYEPEYRYIFNSILYDTVLYRTVQNLILFIQKIFVGAEENIQSFKQDPIERGIAFMEANFSNHRLKLENVARFVDRNPSYFSHLLMDKTGSSFTDILARIRLKEARRLLSETTKPIKEIAMLTGYSNSNYFSRMFKESSGMSPREFRMNKTIQD